ncbi:unnamed protein product [Rhodiola kirilowii]
MKQKPLHNILIIIHFLTHLHHLHSEPTTTGFTCPSKHLQLPLPNLPPLHSHFLPRPRLNRRPLHPQPPRDLNPKQHLQPLFPTRSKSNPFHPRHLLLQLHQLFILHQLRSHALHFRLRRHALRCLYSNLSVPHDFPICAAYRSAIVPTEIEIGAEVIFPIFCKCVNKTLSGNETNFLVSYVFQANDSFDSVASFFGTSSAKIAAVNGVNPQPLDTIFVPVSRLPNITQPVVSPNVTSSTNGK